MLNGDAFLRPNGHFEDSDGQHAAGLLPGQQAEEAGETGETPPLLSPAGGLFIWVHAPVHSEMGELSA